MTWSLYVAGFLATLLAGGLLIRKLSKSDNDLNPGEIVLLAAIWPVVWAVGLVAGFFALCAFLVHAVSGFPEARP